MHPKSEAPYTQWMRDVWRNRVLFWSVIVGFVSIFPIVSIPAHQFLCALLLIVPFTKIYIPVINDVVFKHAPISWEWGIVFVASILFMVFVETWKYVKRIFYRRLDRKAGFVRSETLDDQRYDPMQQIC